ncbi:ankyrin repeat domain-containing protein 13C [Adelges cooleyi]|uniref:ankyrin repeat domain-containing protein 13C n=1 Tax=Adelges cooleyi TaxID=133065 RepID=UPI00217F8BBE|nr:ankyrin repeat domain-containing protein 13C [Adelges cooleyi]
MAEEEESYPLHECVFSGDVKEFARMLRIEDLAKKDKHGNTALHLAIMLGRKDIVQLLLAHNAPVKVKNLSGWTPLAEAVSYGDRITITSLLKKMKHQAREQIEDRRPNLVSALKQVGDFYMEIKWDFQSWVPLVSRVLPSDLCQIHKKGTSFRLDTTLVDFAMNDMKWERGEITFLFDGDAKPSQSLTVMDNKAGVYQKVRYLETEMEIEDEVDLMMSNDIMTAQMSTKSITFSRAQSGWIFRQDKKETIGDFSADFYHVNGLTLESKKRREHLSEEDLQKNKAILESLTKGGCSMNIDCNGEPVRRESLPSPKQSPYTWEEYLTSSAGQPPNLAREMVCKNSSKGFKATVAMSMDFPLSVDMLMDVLEVIAPFKHFAKLRDFVNLRLPPGFPVKLDIPILPTVSAKITFQAFEFRNDIDPELFEVPSNYVEDPSRFPDL